MSGTFPGSWKPTDQNGDLSAFRAIVAGMLGQIGTISLVEVLTVSPGGTGQTGTVDVQIMTHQQDGNGTVMPHGAVHSLPYWRLQAGSSAVVLDPVAGDIGISFVCARDISKVVATRAVAAPDTARQFDQADGLYLGAYLGGPVTQFIEFLSSGITVTTPGAFTVNAGSATFSCDVVAGGHSVGHHDHGNVQNGSGVTGPPIG